MVKILIFKINKFNYMAVVNFNHNDENKNWIIY